MLTFYLHSISAISLTILYFAALVAIGATLQLILGNQGSTSALVEARETLATGLGFLAIALPLWWLHWRRLLGRFSQGDETAAGVNRFYLYTVLCLNAIVILFSGGLGLRSLGRLALGVADDLPSDLINGGVFLSSLGLSVVIWRHHWRQFQTRRIDNQ